MSIFKRLGKNNSKGFTLIELLVVIAIIGILATLLLVQLGTARSRARDAQRVANISSLRTAVELFNGENARYPDGCLVAAAGCVAPFTNTQLAMSTHPQSIQPYLSATVLPTDPLSNTHYSYNWNIAGAATKFQVAAELETAGHVGFRADSDVSSLAAGSWGVAGQGAQDIDGAQEAGCTAAAAWDCIYDLGQP